MIRMLARLFRWRLCLMNGVAAVTGYLLMPTQAPWLDVCRVFFAVSFLAAGSSALNQLIEREIDPLMSRTRNRPIPAGALTPTTAFLIGVACLGAGILLLMTAGAVTASLIGAAIALWYLGIYTPIKRRSRFSLLVGALCGAATPLIGWSVAGGGITEFPPLLLALFLYFWQIPHFLFLQRRHRDDLRRAGFLLFDLPSPVLSAPLLSAVWSLAVNATLAMLALFQMIPAGPTLYCLPVLLLLAALLPKRVRGGLFNCFNLLPLLIALLLWHK
jgi:heme o synthase